MRSSFVLTALISISLVNVVAQAKQPESSKSPETFDRLDSLATLAMSASDGNGHCGMSSGEALRIMPLLHGAVDQAREREAKARRLRPWSKCQAECHCGAWADLAESLGKRGPDEKTRKTLRDQASRQSPKETQRCAKAVESWACKSELLRELRAEAK